MRGTIKKFGLVAVVIAIMLVATACTDANETPGGEQSRKEAISERWQNFELAEAVIPAPQQQNFPLRALLAEYTERQDLLNHPWFTYILGENGNAVSYFVSTTVPVNVCAFLSATEDVKTHSYGNMVLTAPSLDGIYYGGAAPRLDRRPFRCSPGRISARDPFP